MTGNPQAATEAICNLAHVIVKELQESTYSISKIEDILNSIVHCWASPAEPADGSRWMLSQYHAINMLHPIDAICATSLLAHAILALLSGRGLSQVADEVRAGVSDSTQSHTHEEIEPGEIVFTIQECDSASP